MPTYAHHPVYAKKVHVNLLREKTRQGVRRPPKPQSQLNRFYSIRYPICCLLNNLRRLHFSVLPPASYICGKYMLHLAELPPSKPRPIRHPPQEVSRQLPLFVVVGCDETHLVKEEVPQGLASPGRLSKTKKLKKINKRAVV